MWETQKRHLERLDAAQKENPRIQALIDLISTVSRIKAKHGAQIQIVITGDWNFNLTKCKGKEEEWLTKLVNEGNFVNVQDKWVKTKPRTFKPKANSFKNSTWIDHTLITDSTVKAGGIYGSAVLQHEQIADSDHRPSLIGVNFKKCLAIEPITGQVNIRRKRTLLATHKKSAKTYRQKLNKIMEAHPHLIAQIRRGFKRAKKCKRKKGYEFERCLIQDTANKLMEELTAVMLEAEETMPGHKSTPQATRRRKSGWSPKFVKKAREMRKVVSILRRVKATNNNERRERLANEIFKTYGIKFELTKLPTMSNTAATKWTDWTKYCKTKLERMRTKLGAKHRLKERLKMNNHVQKVEKMRQNSRTKGFWYQFIKVKSKQGSSPLVVATWEVNPSNGVKILKMHTGAQEVITEEEKYLPQHMNGAKNPYFQTNNGEQHPFLGKTKEAKEARRRYQIGEGPMEKIPDQFKEVFEESKIKKSKITNEPITELVRDIFVTEIPKHLWREYLAGKKKNTSPGKSGIRVDHIAAANKQTKEMT